MAMKIPTAGNPFSVGVAQRSVEGLMTNKGTSVAKARYTEFEKQVDKWNAEQDELAANDLINQIEANDEKLKSEYSQLQGKNAVQHESGKSLQEVSSTARKDFFDSLNIGAYSPAVRKKVMAYNQAKENYFRRDINRHVIRQQAVYQESVDQENFANATRMALSEDPTTYALTEIIKISLSTDAL